MKLFVRPAAASDIEGAFEWYESRLPGLGNEFLAALNQALSAVQESPERYRVVHREIRRAHLRRFPYSVYYRHDDDAIVIVACFHGSRDPKVWRARR